MSHRNRGSISAFVVCVFLGLTAVTGLVFDGGRVITAYAEISDIAENAARIGCQQVSGIRAGKPYVDKSLASTEVFNFLSSQGIQGEVAIRDGGASVTVQRTVTMKLLSLIGIGKRTIKVTRSSSVVSG